MKAEILSVMIMSQKLHTISNTTLTRISVYKDKRPLHLLFWFSGLHLLHQRTKTRLPLIESSNARLTFIKSTSSHNGTRTTNREQPDVTHVRTKSVCIRYTKQLD